MISSLFKIAVAYIVWLNSRYFCFENILGITNRYISELAVNLFEVNGNESIVRPREHIKCLANA